MGHSSPRHPPRPPSSSSAFRHGPRVAMIPDRNPVDGRSDRGRSGLGAKDSRRSRSPPPHRSHPTDVEKSADRRRPNQPKDRPEHTSAYPPSRRGRNRDRFSGPSRTSSGPRRDKRDLSSRPGFAAGSQLIDLPRSRQESLDISDRADNHEASTSKRRRSRSPSPTSSQRKRSRRERNHKENQDPRPRIPKRGRDGVFPSRGSRTEVGDRAGHFTPSSSTRGRSVSLEREPVDSRTNLPSLGAYDGRRSRSRSRSARPEGFQHSSSRPQSPHSRGGRPATSSSTTPRERRPSDINLTKTSYPGPPHRSPRGQKRSGRRSRQREGTGSAKDPAFASGANSVEVNMAARGPYRGFNHQSTSGNKPPYGSGGNDPRGFSQSPQHATPNSSYHNSPASQSSQGGRGRWDSQQHSPPHHHTSQHPSGNYGPPTGPQSHYHSNSAHSPPYSAPTGPMQQFSHSTYRGGNYRGNPGGFRGNHFGSNRGGYRGPSFKNPQNPRWSPGSQGPGPKGQQNQSDDSPSQQTSLPESQQEHVEDRQNQINDNGTPSGRSKGSQAEAARGDGKNGTGEMPPPDRPPPTGPGASKFSFAFKASSKPTPTTPKPEISQKFNAAPQRREPEQSTVKDNDIPKNAPTEPASSRAKHQRETRRLQEPAPKPIPRTRKVKKLMKRPKPRATLPSDLAASDSVYHRKPGNESVVGSGTYGKVFKGLHVYSKGLVALKRIRMDGEKDGFPVTAIREIKLLQSLRHTNIVNLQEVMVEKNECFMVFEYLSHDLTGLLNHPTFKLNAAQKKHLAKQLFEGLDYLHKRGVLHRDIKAANILVSRDGILKLADFGLARFYAKRHQLDYTNRVITIWYRSPELLLGETQYGGAVDVWSGACVLFEIFTRHAIFPGDGTEANQLEKIYAILGTPTKEEWPGLIDLAWFELLRPVHRRPSTFAERYQDKLSPAAFDLLAAMFRYDPGKRPTATEVLEHPYFISEDPPPRQAVELQNIDGDWHEFESKALRRENERKDREARKMAGKEAQGREKDAKRPSEAPDEQREAKRPHLGDRAADGDQEDVMDVDEVKL